MNKLVFASLIFISSISYSENEMDGWYKGQNGLYLVQEMLYGNLYATVAYSKANKPSIYFIRPYDTECPKLKEEMFTHNPLYINKKLVRVHQYCEGYTHYFYPATETGNDYVIKQFSKSDIVEVRIYDDDKTKFIFSAKNFKEVYLKLLGQDQGI